MDRAAHTPHDGTTQEQAGREAVRDGALHELAGRQATLHDRVVRLEKKLGKQELYCKQLAGLMRSDTRRLTKQIFELQHKVTQSHSHLTTLYCMYSLVHCL